MAAHRTLLASALATAVALLSLAAQPAGEESCGEGPITLVPAAPPGPSAEPANPFRSQPVPEWTGPAPRPLTARAEVPVRDPARRTARASLATFTVRGVVVGMDGTPWSGLHVAPARQPEGGAVTDAAGRFEFVAPARTDVLVCNTGGFTALQSPALRRNEELRLVVSRSIAVDVEVIDGATGLALLGANVCLVTEGKPRPKRTSNHLGFVRFDQVPERVDSELRVTRPGFHAASVPVPSGGKSRMVITLKRRHWRPTVVGTVVDTMGRPVPGATVALGKARARASASGRFELEMAAPSGATLSAYHPTRGVGSQSLPLAAQPGGAPLEATLVLAHLSAGSPPVFVRDPSGRSLGAVRLVPIDGNGDADSLAAHWLTARTDAQGRVTLPPGVDEFAAVDKIGTVLARVRAH